MSRVLLVDTNVSSSPIYDFLVDEGHEVYVIGGNSKDYLAKSVKNYINIDYSDISKVEQLIAQFKIDYLVPGCNDRSYLVCAQLNSRGQFYGIDSLETTETINNKAKFRQFSRKIGLPVPRVFMRDEVADIWPLIVKPVDAFSGRGVTVVHEDERTQLDSIIENAKEFSSSKSCIIEEYVEGQLYSHTAFISGEKIITDFIVQEHCTINPFVVDTSCVDDEFSELMLHRIRDAIELMAKNLSLVDGLVHTQFIKDGDLFWFIEITRRCPGDLYSQLIEFTTSYKYAENYTRPFINQNIQPNNSTKKKSRIMRHTISQSTEGFFGAIKFKKAVYIEKFVPLSLAGDFVKASPFGRIGILFVKADSKNEFDDLFRNTLEHTLYLIDGQKGYLD